MTTVATAERVDETDEVALLRVLVEKALVAGAHVSQESLIVHFAFAEQSARPRAWVEAVMTRLAKTDAVELGGRPPACSLTFNGLLRSPYETETRRSIATILAALRQLTAQNPRPNHLRWSDLQSIDASLAPTDYNLVRLAGTLSYLFWSSTSFAQIVDEAALRETSFGVPPDLLDVVLCEDADAFLAYRSRTPPILATLRVVWQSARSVRGVQLAIDEVYDHLRRTAQWPAAKAIDRTLAAAGNGRLWDLRDTPFFRGFDTSGVDTRTSLTLEGVLARGESFDDALIAGVLRVLAHEYRDHGTEEFSAPGLLARVRLDIGNSSIEERDLQRCLAFLEREAGIFVRGNVTNSDDFKSLGVSVTSDILEYCCVRDLTEAICASKLRQARYWGAGIQLEGDEARPLGVVSANDVSADSTEAQWISTVDPEEELPVSGRASDPARFLIGDKLGAGVFGDVWRAKDNELRRDVAIKVIRATGATRSDVLQHAQALARVSHASIVAVYQVTQIKDPLSRNLVDAVVMELVDGVVLRDRIRTTVDLRDSTRIGVALIEAVAQYHVNSIAHMDLHEGNVIVGVDVVKVLDPLYLDTALFASSATREAHQRRDLNALRDLLCQVLQVTEGVAFPSIDEFRRGTVRAGTVEIRRAFETVLASAARVAVSQEPAAITRVNAVNLDFDESIARGQEGHAHAVRAHAEIREVLRNLSASVRARTDGKVAIEHSVKRTIMSGFAMLTDMSSYLDGELAEDVRNDALYAFRVNGRSGDRMALCKLTIDGHGYPVTVMRNEPSWECSSKEELVRALRRVVADPEVAGNIERVRRIAVETPKLVAAAHDRVIDVAAVETTPDTTKSGGEGT